MIAGPAATRCRSENNRDMAAQRLMDSLPKFSDTPFLLLG
jgi:hypothetical protein